jgi:Zn-dependent protease
VSFAPSELIRTCKRCSAELAPDALSCKQCHALVHAEELERLAANANLLQAQGQPDLAREQWSKAIELLPPDSTQAKWVRERVRRLGPVGKAEASSSRKDHWARKLGPLAPIALALAKGNVVLSLFNLKFILSLAAFLGVYWGLFGAKFGIGFAVLILIHEMGHFIDVRRRSLPAEMPVFLPGLGAYVRWRALGVSQKTRSAVSLAGPLAGSISAAVCLLIWWKTGSGVMAALARAGAWLNVLNLIPVWALDGGQAILALNKSERLILLTVAMALWLFMGESVFFLVALGIVWRLFTKDIPRQPSPSTTAYFATVLTLLALVMRLVPGKGFGAP